MSERMFIGLEFYVPTDSGQELDLAKGTWRPHFQQNGLLVRDRAVTIPVGRDDDNANIYRPSLDRFLNIFGHPIMLKSMSFTWDPSYAASFNHFALDARLVGPTREFSFAKPLLRCVPRNVPETLIGNASSVLPYVYEFAAAVILRKGQSIHSEVAAVDSEAEYTFAEAAAANKVEAVYFGEGVETGRQYRFSNSGLDEEVARHNYVNEYDEDIRLTAMAIYSPTAAAKRPLFKVAVGRDEWSESERLFWLFAQPFPYARVDFCFLPGGGMVVLPDEKFLFGIDAQEV